MQEDEKDRQRVATLWCFRGTPGCVLDDDAVARIQTAYDSGKYTPNHVYRRVEFIVVLLEPLDVADEESLSQWPHAELVFQPLSNHAYVMARTLSKLQTEFRGTALTVVKGASRRSYAFATSRMKPFRAYFAPLVPLPPLYHGEVSWETELDNLGCDHLMSFKFEAGHHFSDREVFDDLGATY